MRTAERMVSSAWPNEVAKLATSAQPQRAARRAPSESARDAERKGCRRDQAAGYDNEGWVVARPLVLRLCAPAVSRRRGAPTAHARLWYVVCR